MDTLSGTRLATLVKPGSNFNNLYVSTLALSGNARISKWLITIPHCCEHLAGISLHKENPLCIRSSMYTVQRHSPVSGGLVPACPRTRPMYMRTTRRAPGEAFTGHKTCNGLRRHLEGWDAGIWILTGCRECVEPQW